MGCYYRRLADGRRRHADAARARGAAGAAAARLLPDPRDDAQRFKAAHYRKHIELFPDGQFVALDGDRSSARPRRCACHFDFQHINHTFADIIQGGWLTSHEPDGDWLYGADVGVHPAYRGRGIAAALYAARQERSGASASRARSPAG